jgi:hypothetical protein
MTHDFGYVALDILHVYPEDSGTFLCRATSATGTCETRTRIECIQRKHIYTESQHPESWRRIKELEAARPRPAGAPVEPARVAPVFTQQLVCPAEVKEGQSVHMECVLQPIDDATIVIEWLHNGRPILMGSRIRTMHDFGYVAMEIYHVHPEDIGTYTCRATNALGTADTQAKIVHCAAKGALLLDPQHMESWMRIQEMEARRPGRDVTPDSRFPPPTFTAPLRNAENLNEGDAVRLQCRLEPANDPTMRVHWLKNDEPLQQGRRGTQHL